MMGDKRQETMYHDVNDTDQPAKDGTHKLAAKPTVYHEAQPIHLPEPTPRAVRSRSSKGLRFLCCFGSGTGGVDEAPVSPPVVDEHGHLRKLSAIKEASLTREQIIRRQTEQKIVIDRSQTIYKSFGKSDHPDFGDESVPLDSQRSLGVERKLSAAGTFKNIVRKFTAQKSIELQDKPLEFESKPKLERKQSIVQSMKSMLKRKPSVILPSAPVLSDEEYEHLKKFDGIWYAQYEKNKHGNAEISRVMALGWGLKKALDNVPFFELIISKSTSKNTAKVFGLVDIREERPWSGQRVPMKRKDLRGMSTTWLEKTPDGFVVRTEWPDPFAAEVSEAFKLDEDGNLIMSVKIKRKSGESCDIQLNFSKKK